jgi:3-phosphoshikimate 1-carboxyvinyltransferase
VESSPLVATSIKGDVIPRLIDEIPVLSLVATFAKGETAIRGAEELRVKESDRILAMERELSKLGAKIKSFPDGLKIMGPTIPQSHQQFESGGDHRVAMTMAIAATQAKAPSIIEDIECIKTSYPNFFESLKRLGGKVDFL